MWLNELRKQDPDWRSRNLLRSGFCRLVGHKVAKKKPTKKNAARWAKRRLNSQSIKHPSRNALMLFDLCVALYPDAKATNLEELYLECKNWVDFKVPKKKRTKYGVSVSEAITIPKNKQTRKHEYSEYLKSATWRNLRIKALDINDCCVLCSRRKNLNVHHRKYPKIFGTEPVEWLTVLCAKCHNLFHEHRQVARH